LSGKTGDKKREYRRIAICLIIIRLGLNVFESRVDKGETNTIKPEFKEFAKVISWDEPLNWPRRIH
jgi:hypothetical protein